MGKTVLFCGKIRGFIQFFPVLPKQRFTLGKTWVNSDANPDDACDSCVSRPSPPFALFREWV